MAKRASRVWARWLVGLCCWAAAGCAKHADMMEAAAPTQVSSAEGDRESVSEPAEPSAEAAAEAPPADPPPALVAPAGAPAKGGFPESAAPSAPDADATLAKGLAPSVKNPQLIYTATLTLAVFRTRDAMAAIEKLARDAGGYLVRQNDASITVRVPAPAFRGALDGIGGVGDELHRDVEARDVTDELTDLEVRLRNSEEVRRKLEALLARAENVEHALAVERELERVTRTIEQLKGRLKVLAELLAFSTITVNFQPRPTDTVTRETRLPFEWLRDLGLPSLLSL